MEAGSASKGTECGIVEMAVQTQEAANVAAFLLSPRSSGINAQSIVVDAGMSINYFDADIVRRAMRPETE